MLKKEPLRIGLQYFAEGDPTDPAPAPKPQLTPTPAPTTDPVPKPQGKVWTDEYVQGLREEAKTHRVAKKELEKKFKTMLGLKDDEELDDSKISAYQQNQQTQLATALQKANERLLLAEIKNLEGYDYKLVERLLDKSKVAIADDGTVTGLAEAVEALALEFPQIKQAALPTGGAPANPPGKGGLSEADSLKQQYTEALSKGKLADAISLKNRIFEVEHKK